MIYPLEFCSICGVPLDQDNLYGTNRYPLCRDHHEKCAMLEYFVVGLAGHVSGCGLEMGVDLC
jgi:hypothetical protein